VALAGAARKALADTDARIGGGTDAYFTELNRARPPVRLLDHVGYTLNPQVHAFDDASLVETLETQAVTVGSARQFCGSKPLAIGPVTLKPRFNPAATTSPEPLAPGELPSQVDVRQMSLLGAGWTLGSLKYLSRYADVQSLTYYETTGWRGVMARSDGSSAPWPALPGMVYPMYHVFADVGEFAGGERVAVATSDTLAVDGLALQKGRRRCLWLANLTARAQQIVVCGWASRARVRTLDAGSAERAMTDPDWFRSQKEGQVTGEGGRLSLSLAPFAFVRLDVP
jgi:hypothetical protein